MKKLLITLIISILTTNTASAMGNDYYYRYYDNAAFFSNNAFPQSVSKVGSEEEISIEDLNKLKKGQSRAINVLNLVERGNASINKAAKEANITKIYYVDQKVGKVYVPFFIPFYFKEKITIVYGE